jgi:pyruvate dehydrogenase E2 component (dihydrolipoamide acetyltransferase)
MAVNVVMPQMGESIFEGTVTKWLKKPGDKIERDEPLFEISTDKVDAEIPAPAAGVLKEIKVEAGQTVAVQTVVAIIEAAGSAAATGDAPVAPAPAAASDETPAALPGGKGKAAAAPAPVKAAAKVEAKPAPAAAPAIAAAPAAAASRPAASGDGQRIHSSPLVRRLARENNVDLAPLAGTGTGAGGRISKKDILSVISSGAARPAAAGTPVSAGPSAGAAAVPRERIYFGRYDVAPMSVMRQKIAEHMVASKRTSPHVYSIEEADMTRIAQLRARVKEEFEKRHETKLTFMPFFLSAAVEALRAFPVVNSSVDGNSLVMHREINLGIAVALEAGLIVPVVKGADEKNFLGLQRAVNDLAERARTKKLKPEEVQDSTFSITNPGSVGGLMGLAVINQPNVAILGIGAIQKRPVVVNDAIGIRSMVYLTLSYDHRAVDGAIAHQFMLKVKSSLENWEEEIL